MSHKNNVTILSLRLKYLEDLTIIHYNLSVPVSRSQSVFRKLVYKFESESFDL